MEETLKQIRQRRETCRSSKANNASDRDTLAGLNRQKNKLWSEIQELKARLSVAVSTPDRLVDQAANAGTFGVTCLGLLKPPKACLAGTVRALFKQGWQQESEIAGLRYTIASKQAEYEGIKSQIALAKEMSKLSGKSFKDNDCYGSGLWLDR